MYTPVNEARVSCGLISPFSETQGLAIPWQTHGILFALWSARPWQLEDKHCIISQTNKRGVDASPLAHTRKPREIHHGSVIRFFFLSLTWGPDKSRPSWLRWTQRPISDSPIRITPLRSGNIYISSSYVTRIQFKTGLANSQRPIHQVIHQCLFTVIQSFVPPPSPPPPRRQTLLFSPRMNFTAVLPCASRASHGAAPTRRSPLIHTFHSFMVSSSLARPLIIWDHSGPWYLNDANPDSFHIFSLSRSLLLLFLLTYTYNAALILGLFE